LTVQANSMLRIIMHQTRVDYQCGLSSDCAA
jgi:hypothetical protein